MSLLRAASVSSAYGAHIVLDDVSLTIGKSTLLRVLAQEEQQGGGKVLRRDARSCSSRSQVSGRVAEGSLPDLGRAVPRRSWLSGRHVPDSCGLARVRFVQSRCRWPLTW